MASSNRSQEMFNGARDFTIDGGHITAVAGNNYTNATINQYRSTAERPGLKRLLDNIAQGACYNAAERGDPPRCHPQTRKAIRAEIMEWVAAPPGMRKLILWMYGPAGSGKTAIAQSIAEECARLGLLAASFFFWRTAAGRNNASRFIATLAYQLSRKIPQMEEHLLTAIENDPTIFSLSLSDQMRVLVVDPLKLAAPSLSTAMFAIVDGVDECGPDGQSQAELLRLLASLASELQHLPLIFLIASRPEYQIRKAFNDNLLKPLTKVLVLDDDYEPDEDIKIYFDSTFRDICEEHRQLGSRLPSPWPTAPDVDSLVSKASGQFIFAATVTKFIDSPRHNPVERLNIILRLSTSGNETPFALLDELYCFILDSVVDVEKVLDILALLLLDYIIIQFLNEAEELLGIKFRSTLIDMHSLLSVPPPSDDDDEEIELPRVYHASLGDFLMDRSRSRQYYIGRSEGHLRLSKYCLKAMRKFPHFEHLSLRDVVHASGDLAEESPANEDLANDLAQLDLGEVLRKISYFESDLYQTDWQGFFNGAKKLVGSDRPDIGLRLQNDFDTFVLNRIAQYPPSLRSHIPALLCLLDGVDTNYPRDLFHILLLGASNSAEEYTEFRTLDRKLLTVEEAFSEFEREHQTWELLFRDKSRAGKCFVDGQSFVALAKAIVSVIFSRPGERNRQIRFSRNGDYPYLYVEASCDPKTRTGICSNKQCLILMEDVLEKASTDWDLANFLHERAVQYRDDVEPIQGRQRIAQASIEYIERCGIPFVEHSHQQDMNKCAICDCCEDAVVVEDIPDAPMEPLPLPSIEYIEDSSSDSESMAHNACNALSIGREAVVTPIPSASRLPPISQWYKSVVGPAASPQQSTSYFYAPSCWQFDAQKSTTVPSAQYEALTTQNSSSSTPLPSISEWYQSNDTVFAPQSKRKRVDTLTDLVVPPAYRFEGFEKGKRRMA